MAHSHAQETQGLFSPFLARQRYKQASRYIRVNDVVLDIGCGSGDFGKFLPEKVEYYGVDTANFWGGASDHLYVAKVGSVLPEQLRNRKFSTITSLALIEHLDMPAQIFVDASKVLAVGGRLVLTTPHPLARKVHDKGGKMGLFSSHASDEHETFLDKEDMLKLAEKEGFMLVDYRRFLFGMNQVAVFEKS